MTLSLVLVSHYFSSHGGGVELVAGRLVSELCRRYDVHVIWLASAIGPYPEDLPPSVVCKGVSAWNITEDRLQIPFPIWGINGWLSLWSNLRQADLVHLHDCLYPGNAMAWLIAKWFGIPIIVTQHIGAKPYDQKLVRSLLEFLNRTVARAFLSRAEKVVFISHRVQSYFGSFCRFRAPPEFIPNGVDISVFREVSKSQTETIRDELGIPRPAFVHLFVGRFVGMKGLPVLRELARAFPGDVWIFAGAGPINPEQWGMANVRVMRDMNGASLARLFQAADLLLLPSKSEGFPLVVQEAMACGTPVLVCEDVAMGYPEAASLMFVEKVGPCDTVLRWVRHLSKLRKHPDQLRELRPALAKFARENWCWEKAAIAYGELMTALVTARRR